MAKVNPIQMQKFLKGLNYPASKNEVVKHAESHGADENARSALRQLPDQTFGGPTAVSRAVGQIDVAEKKSAK